MPVPRTSRAVAAPIFFTSSGSLPRKTNWDERVRILNWSEKDAQRCREEERARYQMERERPDEGGE